MWKHAILLGGCVIFAAGATRFLWLGGYFAFGEPVLACEAPEFDFGTGKPGDRIRHVFRILNEGREELHIRKVRKDCGCTVAELSAEKISPGGHADVTVELTLQPLSGVVQKRVLLDTNDSRNPVSVFVMRGSVETDIHVEPRMLAVDMDEPDAKEQEFDLFSENYSFEVTNAYANESCLNVRFETVVKGRRYRVYVSKSDSGFAGTASLATVFVRTDHQQESLLPVQIQLVHQQVAGSPD
jgi:Protein of unknown function (DUF1573)